MLLGCETPTGKDTAPCEDTANCAGALDDGNNEGDEDGDGYTPSENDCDDGDADVNPDGVELCDGIDNNCDGVVDEGVSTPHYIDADGDGFG